jgi:diguanylate cyclase (GGDEF)-like protein
MEEILTIREERDFYKNQAEELRISHQRLIDFIATGSDVIWETNADFRLLNGLQIVQRDNILDVESPPANAYMLGHTIKELLGENGVCDPSLETHLSDLRARRPFRGFTCKLPSPDGSTTWMESNGNPFFDECGAFQGYRGTTRDISRHKTDQERVAFIAQHDSLTGLPNRSCFRERVEQALNRSRDGASVAVMFLDLDRFKMVNDTLGHPIGDMLLRAVAERLSGCLSDVDTVGRLGGDEFAIVQVGMETPGHAASLAARMITAIGEPFDLDGHYVSILVTIGIALAPRDGSDCDELLKNADIALYRAKLDEPGTWRFFEPEMRERLEKRRTVEMELRCALANDEFELFYQPIHNVESGQVSAFEALLRWRHPVRGMVLPQEFIPVTEETGMIVPLGAWVLRQACVEASAWPDHISLAVNLSPVQFKNRMLVDVVKAALAESGFPANRLELEITEAAMMQNSEATIAVLNELRSLGVRISMDDFGTGYSSLSYLRNFPFDKIKIDRSFIRDLTQKPGTSAIVRAIAGLGASLQLATTAEGVETQEQLTRLQAEGLTEVQGYSISMSSQYPKLPQLIRKPVE